MSSTNDATPADDDEVLADPHEDERETLPGDEIGGGLGNEAGGGAYGS